MKKKNLWTGILAVMLVFAMTVAGCDDGTASGNGKKNNGNENKPNTNEPQKVEFTGYDADGNLYTLTLTENTENTRAAVTTTTYLGYNYVLIYKIEGLPDRISEGVVSAVNNDTLELQPYVDYAPVFGITVSAGDITITMIVGVITFNSGGTVNGPGALTPEGSLETLPGNVTISPSGNVTTGTELTADYSGSEAVTYRWNKGGTPIQGAAGSKFILPEAGSYTVTASATGFKSKTSAAVTVTGDPVTVPSASVEMVNVPGGSFQMGDVKNEAPDWVGDSEKPVHTVTLNGFSMSKYPVTQEQYQAVIGSNPSYYHGGSGREPASGEVQGKRPVESVSWYDAIEFCNALSVKEGLSPYYTIDKANKDPNNSNSYDTLKWTVTRDSAATGYRLPTEVQWEYAAKGGDGSPGNYTYSGSNTVGDVAWYDGNSNSRTHEVGMKAPNGLGIYDMSGNVGEWCWDWYGGYSSGAQTDPVGPSAGAFRVIRGGSWSDDAVYTRSAYRDDSYPNFRIDFIGFRLVRP